MARAEKQFDLNVWMRRTGRVSEIKGPGNYSDVVVRVVYPRIYCVDGFHMSIQASEIHYSTPRDNHGPYTAVEVGYPSMYEELLTNPENQSKPLETIYPWVEVEVVERIVVKHGGIAE